MTLCRHERESCLEAARHSSRARYLKTCLLMNRLGWMTVTHHWTGVHAEHRHDAVLIKFDVIEHHIVHTGSCLILSTSLRVVCVLLLCRPLVLALRVVLGAHAAEDVI